MIKIHIRQKTVERGNITGEIQGIIYYSYIFSVYFYLSPFKDLDNFRT